MGEYRDKVDLLWSKSMKYAEESIGKATEANFGAFMKSTWQDVPIWYFIVFLVVSGGGAMLWFLCKSYIDEWKSDRLLRRQVWMAGADVERGAAHDGLKKAQPAVEGGQLAIRGSGDDDGEK